MWEPFSEPARRAIVRAQEVAAMFGSTFIGTEHIAFALAEGDDDLGHLLAKSLDREAIRERLGGASSAPSQEMVFSTGAKRSIESAFENARRLNHSYIGPAHLALGILASGDPPPMLSGGDPEWLRAALDQVANGDDPLRSVWKKVAGSDDLDPAMHALVTSLQYLKNLATPGTRISITVTPPNGEERTWAWTRLEKPE
jgi:ATP-dependent Clp protease ATP-binding subunit ClpA